MVPCRKSGSWTGHGPAGQREHGVYKLGGTRLPRIQVEMMDMPARAVIGSASRRQFPRRRPIGNASSTPSASASRSCRMRPPARPATPWRRQEKTSVIVEARGELCDPRREHTRHKGFASMKKTLLLSPSGRRGRRPRNPKWARSGWAGGRQPTLLDMQKEYVAQPEEVISLSGGKSDFYPGCDMGTVPSSRTYNPRRDRVRNWAMVMMKLGRDRRKRAAMPTAVPSFTAAAPDRRATDQQHGHAGRQPLPAQPLLVLPPMKTSSVAQRRQ